MNIEPGSHFLEMPTQGGRHAIVIFPPGQQSLTDIKYMMGDEDHGETRNLVRVIGSGSGGGRFFLRAGKKSSKEIRFSGFQTSNLDSKSFAS